MNWKMLFYDSHLHKVASVPEGIRTLKTSVLSRRCLPVASRTHLIGGAYGSRTHLSVIWRRSPNRFRYLYDMLPTVLPRPINSSPLHSRWVAALGWAGSYTFPCGWGSSSTNQSLPTKGSQVVFHSTQENSPKISWFVNLLIAFRFAAVPLAVDSTYSSDLCRSTDDTRSSAIAPPTIGYVTCLVLCLLFFLSGFVH